MKKKFLLMMMLSLLFTAMGTSVLRAANGNVAKVGNTEYATIDEAIAAWTNGTTLTLLADVTLSNVIQLSSTEYHILDLGTYTMTAASGKDAIQYVVKGRSSASYALDIKADAENPGGITATGKAIVVHTMPLLNAPEKDRPITRFYGGKFKASNIVKQGGTFGAGYTGARSPYFYFYGGEFNGNISTNRSTCQFFGGTFNGKLYMSVDSSAYGLVAGGTFKDLSNYQGSALNSDKFTIGSAKGVYDKEVYIDDNGNYVIAAAEPSEGIEADVAKTPGTNDYLAYSKVATEGQLGYTDVYTALEKNTTATVTVYVEELDMSEVTNFSGTIVVPENSTITITNAPEGLKVTDINGKDLSSEDGTYTTIVPKEVATYDELVAALANGGVIKLTADITATGAVDGTGANIDLNGKTLKLNVGDNNFFGDSKVKNGYIDITGCVASGDCIIGIGNYSNSATLTFDNVNVTGDGYSSAYAVLYVYNSSELNVNGGSVVVSNDNASAGGVIKAHKAADGKINIVGTEGNPVELTFNNAKIGMLDGTVLMNYVDLDITGGANAINQSVLTIKNSTLDITGADGRALTLSQGNVVVENSTLNFSDCSEGEIRFKKSLELTADINSTINTCTTYADASATEAKINGVDVDASESSMAFVTVENGTTTVKEAPKGNNFTGYTGEDRIWGEVWGNASESFVIKVLDANGNVMGTTSLNNKGGIIDGDVNVTWNLLLNAGSNTDEYWTMEWTAAPKINNMPAKVELWVDGVKVSGGDVDLNGPDEINKIYAAVTYNDGKIHSYHTSIANAVDAITGTSSAEQPNVIALLRHTDETVTLPAGITLNLNGFTAANVSVPVAQIGDVEYTTLQAAFDAVKDGETITLIDNVTVSVATAAYNDGTYIDGVRYTGDKSFTVDFNGKTVTDDGCVNDYLIYINNKGGKASEITFTNGTIVSKNGCWSAVCVNSSAATQNVKLNLNGMNITNSNDAVYSGNPVVRVRTLATVNVNDGTTITSNGASYGVAANTDGSTVNINEGATIIQQNSGTTGGNSVFAAVGGKGVINIKGGTITSDRYGVHTMTTGTPVINISGGTITAPVALKSSTNGGNGELATINVTGGTINGTLETNTENGKIVVSGGTFSEAVKEEYCAEGYVPVKNADGTYGVELAPVAEVGENTYRTFAEAAAAAQAGDEIKLLANIEGNITVPANVTLNGNGFAISGGIFAEGDITFAGVTTAADFDANVANTAVNIPAGASLQLTGTARLVIGHGATFNITGTIEDAKTADKATLVPSLKIAAGASITGNGVTFNVNNAYIVAEKYCSSKNSNANGTFNFNINNSIWDQTGNLQFSAPTNSMDPTVNFNLANSVLTTTSHVIFSVTKGEVVIDNSKVNEGVYRQLENRSTMTVKNGSVVNGAVATSENAKNPGTIIVENATYAVTGEFSGSDLGTGTIVYKKGATISAGSITKANIQIDATGMAIGDVINFTADLSKFTGTLSVINNDNLEAEIIDGKISLVEKPVAKIGETKYATLEAAFKAATSGCTIEILSNVTIDEAWDNRSTGAKFTVPVTINGNDNKLTFKGTVSDGGNYHSVFRFQADATVKNLTIDLANATANNNIVRAISSSANLVVEKCSFIGNNNVNNARAIIFGEGAGANVGNLEISITDSEFINWTRGITDNENAQDVKTVTITGNTLTSSAVYVSAKETVTFTGNTVSGAYVNIRSYSDENNLSVIATGNTLEENTVNNYNYIYAKNIEAQEEFTTENPPVKVSTKAELDAAINAAKDGDVIEMTADIDYGTSQLAIAKAITLDLGGKTLTTRNAYGGMSIKNNPTIKNGNIVHASNTAAIKVWNATAFEDLVIDVQGKGDANKTIGGIVLQSGTETRVGSIKNVTIKGDALTNGIETYNCGDAEEDVIGSMENVNIDAVGTAMLISAPCGTATNCTFDGGVNGIEIWIKGNYSASLGLVDCDVVGGVFAHDEFSSNPEIVNNGTLNLTADEVTTGAGVDDVTLTLARVEAENVEGVLEVVMEQAEAKVNNTYYQTLAKAVEAAQDGEEIDLLKNVALTSTLLLTKNNILDGNGFMLTPAGGFPSPIDGNNAVIVLAANMSGYEANRTYTVKNLTIEGFSTSSRIVRANFCNATIQDCSFVDNTSESIITSAYAVLNVAGNTFTNNTASYAVINVGSDVSDGTALVAEITGNKFYNNEAAIAGIFLASSADVTDNHFKGNTHTGDNANAAAILAGPYTGNRAYTVNIKSNAFENAMSKGVTALPSVFAEDWSANYGSTTSFDLSLNYWDGNEPVAGTAYKTSGDNPQVTVKSYYKTYTDGTLGGLVEYPQGNNFNGYTRTDAIWGEVWGNAKESFVVKVLDANDNVMGTTSLNNIGGIINGNVNVTWTLKLDAASNTDEYWTMNWTTAPTINNMPAKVELWVDGVKVSGGPVVLNAPDNLSMIYAAVTDNTGKILAYHTNVQEAIKAAAAVTGGARTTTAGTVEFLADVTVDKWIMFSETLSIGNGQIITIEKIEGLTIDGNNHKLTINSIESAGNGNRLFYDATNLNIKDLTINYGEGVAGGIGLKSGTISNVNFNGGVSAIYPGAGEVIITDCTFKTSGHCIYFEEERDNLVVTNNTFELPADANVILLRGDVTFTGNNVKSGRTVNVVSGSPVVTGNNFNDVRFKVYNAASATISENTINNLVFNETDVPTESTFTNNTLSPEAQAAIDALPAIAGEGTEANPYLINDVDDLVWLQEKVDELAQDGSTQFAGKYFKLTNDIDLSGINWNPIGTMSGDHGSFKGVFDGGDHTISNLHVEQAGDGIGLFARTTGNAVIKNLKLNNVTVKSTNNSNYVGGLVGNAYASTKIENVHVSGNVYISGRGYIGGIAGHGYVVMDNVSVDATGDGQGNTKGLITSTFWCAGGVLGYAGEGATNIMNAHVEDVVVTSAAGGLGAIVGMAADNEGTQPISGSNLSAENVEIKTYTGAYGDAYANYALGYLYGGNPTSILTGDLSVEKVTIETSTGEIPEVNDAVAKIGNSIYFNLQAALNAAVENETITLLRDIKIAEKTVIDNRTLTLDGNDKTLTYTGTDRAIDVPNKADADIDFTIKDLTIYAEKANRGINYNENGTLNVDNVTVTIGENVDGYAINFPGMADNAQVTIRNSKLTSRNPLNIWGENMVINVYDSEIISVDNNSTYDYAAIQLNNDNYGNVANGTVVNVYGGTITALNDNGEPSNVVANATETGVVNISDETVVTGKVLNYVANIGGVYFGSLQAAVNAIEKYSYNSPIVIMKSFATSETATVKNGLNVTIDLNGKTITGTDTTSVNFSIIDNRGNLTITDNTVSKEGKITLTATIDSDWSRYSAVIANNPGGKLIIENGTLEHLGGTDMAYGIDNLTNGKGTYAETVINGGTIKSTYRGIRQFLNGTEAQNILTVNGGTIEGANKSIWMQDPSDKANTGTLTVGEEANLIGDVYLYVTPNSTSWPVTVSIAAGALAEGSEVMTANLPVGVDVQNINGTYGVVNVVAQIGDVKYQSLAEAATAAQDGETIQLLWAEGHAPISMAATFVGNKTVTITGTADVDWSKGWFFVGRGGEGDGHVIFDNANLTSTSVGSNSGLGLNVSCKEEGESTTNDGEVEIINSNIQLDYLIGKGNIKLDNSKLEVYEGFAVGARPADETGGEQRTVTMDITNGSNVIVDNHNGQGLGHESNGIMNIDATSTFETKRSFLITANGTMNNAGTVTINGTLTNNGTINLTDVALTGMTIDGTGTTYFYNTVNFYGNNNITTDINGSPFELIVNEDATLLISRFVLGYNRAITVYGNIEDAHNLTAEQVASMTPSLKFNSTSGVSVGGTATGRLTAKDAYLEFGNSSWKNSYAEHTWSFENCYVSATSFGNNNEPGAVTSTWNVTFDNSVLAAKNYIKNGVGVTYNFTNGSVATTGSLRIDGTLNVDANSSVTTTGQQNNVQNAVDEHGGINGTINIDGTLTIDSNSATQLEVLGGEVNVTETGNIKLHGNTLTLDAASKMRSCGNITGAITAAEGADIEITGGTYTQDVNEWCHEYYDAIPNGDGTWTVEQVMYALVRDLQEGWSWFSSFINIDGEAGLTKIKDALGENGVQVKDAYSGSFIQYTSASGWKGLLNEASSKAVYSIKTINDGDDIPEISVKDFTIKGAKVDPSLLENTVYINKGWNYIAYPLDQVAGLDVLSFTPAEGDVIKSKESSSMYWGGVWISNIDMTPGEGYMYKSNDDATKSFNFAYPTRSAVDASISNNVTNDYYWSVNAHKYPSNMTIVAMLNIDNELVKDSYEIAAFANGECRGRAQSVYVESLDTYVLVLTVHGEDVENITFKYYDVNSGAEYELSNIMVYSNDAIVGSVDEPYMFNLDILNVDEASINEVNVYPNPTTTNAEIDLNATCDKVEVFNALGVKVAEYSNVDSIDALETAGVYVIRVTIDGNVRNCRLIVK